MKRRRQIITFSTLVALAACADGVGTSPTSAFEIPAKETTSKSGASSSSTGSSGTLPAIYRHFERLAPFLDGDRVVLITDDLPDHPSPYYSASDPLYENPPAGMVVNPNRITAQSFTFRVPASPSEAISPTETGLGAIGLATNGVVFFNQYAGRSATGFLPLDREIATFDRYNGHPQQTGVYHYHIEPVWLTGDPTAVVGVLLDGFPIYGPLDEDGRQPADLDVCHGHRHPTADAPEGIYHYHVTADPPYISGCYRGAPGTGTN